MTQEQIIIAFILMATLIILVGINIFLTGKKRQPETTDKSDNTLEKITDKLNLQASNIEQINEDIGGFREPLTKLNRYLSGGTLAGTFGEWSLQAIISDILPADKYEENKEVIPGSNHRVEFAVRMPEGLLPIDAKFPSGLYDTYIHAADEGDKERIGRAEGAIKRHVIQDSENIKKRYTQTGITIDLAVMFIPSESLMQLIDSIGDLRQEVFRDNRVLILGPNSLAAYLISINMGFNTLALNQRAEEVIIELGAIKREFERFTNSTDNLVNKADAMVTAVDAHKVRERAMNRAFNLLGEDEEEGEETQE